MSQQQEITPQSASAPTEFDAILIGAGQANPPLAKKLTEAGWKIAFIERARFGGSCVNFGCTPTKTMIASAEVAHQARHSQHWGIDAGPVSVDFAAVRERREKIVASSRQSIRESLYGNDKITVFEGTGRFQSSHVITVNGQRLTAPKIFLDIGTRAHIPDLPGIHDVPYLTASSLLALPELPKHLIIIGGSYISLEFAQMYRRFGSAVTVVEKKPVLASKEDKDISECVRGILEAEGITVRTEAECISLAPHAEGVSVGTNCTTDSKPIVGSHVLIATGRQPNTDDLGADAAGLKLDGKGFVQVDDQCRTSIDGVYAMGDCNGQGAFTHTAFNDYQIVSEDLLEGRHRRISDRIDCWAMYTDPPLAHIGMGEDQIRKLGKTILFSEMPMSKVNRQRERGETLGKMKVFVDKDSEQILGAVILGTGGDEAIHALLTNMYAKISYRTIADAVFIHPTLSELLPTLLQKLEPLK